MDNKVKKKIVNGQKAIGTFIEIATIAEVECLGSTGLDYIIIDTEHGPYDTESVGNLIRGCELANLTPFVRVADITHKELQRCMDLGALGVIAPMLKTMEDFQKLIALSKFAPVGNRGFAGVRSNGYGYTEKLADGIEAYMQECNENVMILPQCETAEALEIIEEVVALDGIDGIFIGPFDLSISLGVPLKFESQIFKDAIDRVLKACKSVNKPAFIYAATLDTAKANLRQGFDSVAYNLDTDILITGYKNAVKALE